MSVRKITVIVDGMFAVTEEDKKEVMNSFQCFREYGAEVKIITDKSFLRGLPKENIIQEATHRIEANGPQSFEYEEGLLKEVEDSEVILVHYNAINSKLMDAAPGLKMIGVMRSGIENVEIEAANDRNIIVCNSPGRVSEPVADFTVGLMLAYTRNISRFDMWHTKIYDPRENEEWPPLMSDLTVGLVGFGIIGKKVTKRLQAFGTSVLIYDPFIPENVAEEYGVKPVSLDELMEMSDVVSVHARLTKETRELIGEKQIALMKPTALFVNTARAGLVNEPALIKALKEKRIGGAALDVYVQEPLAKDSPFFEMDNVLLTPHRAGSAGSFVKLTVAAMREAVLSYLKGEDIPYQVNKKNN